MSDTNDSNDTDDQERMFTQEEVNRFLARAKRQQIPDDYEDLKAKAKRLEELEAASQSDSEKLAKELERLSRERDEALAASKQAAQAVQKERVKSEVFKVASTMKAVDPSDVYALLPESAITIDDDGQVVGVKEAVSTLLEQKPHLVGLPPRPKPDASQGPRDDSKAAGLAGAAEAERRFGVPAGAQ